MCLFHSYNFVIHSPSAALLLTFISTIVQRSCHQDAACWCESAVSRSTDSTFCWYVHCTVPLTVTVRHTTVLEVNWLTTLLFEPLKHKCLFCTQENTNFQKSLAIPGTHVSLTAVQNVSLTVQLQTWTVRKYNWKIKLLFSHVRFIILLTWKIWWAPNNASRWQMGFNSAFGGLNYSFNLSHIYLIKDYSVEFSG
jgi:hypothetical protein